MQRQQIRINEMDAKQGEKRINVLYVLLASLFLAAIAGAGFLQILSVNNPL